MDGRRTLLTDFDARGDAAEDADAAAAALEFFVECEIDHFGDENHCKAFALELAAAYARARRRAAARAGLGDDAATLRPISAAPHAAWPTPPRAAEAPDAWSVQPYLAMSASFFSRFDAAVSLAAFFASSF
ncbi:hypothetical protein SO694_00002676 [Aureococcus anophagefferens]|uniref:Uncharacterized protein n=1 Tax=Aureococcus anophagefferens TaxID=44056 RepID=A0ABR1GDD3_AURAN